MTITTDNPSPRTPIWILHGAHRWHGSQTPTRLNGRDLLGDPLVWSVIVVVLHVVAEYPFKAGIHDQEVIEEFGSDGPHEALGVSVGVGVRSIRAPSERKTLSKPATYLVSRSRTRNLTSSPASTKSPVTFLTCGDPVGVRMGRYPRDRDPSSAQFEEEEHVETMEEHGVDREEVGEHDVYPALRDPPRDGRGGRSVAQQGPGSLLKGPPRPRWGPPPPL